MGLDPARMVAPSASQPRPDFELWEECLLAFEVFAVCRRQWRTGVNMDRVLYFGLDLVAVDVAMRRLDVPQQRQGEVLLHLQVMEDEGVKVLNGR